MLSLNQQIYSQFEKAQNILIVFTADWDGDSVASSLALFLFLKKMGRNVEIVGSENIEKAKSLSFLPKYSEIKDSLINLQKFIVSLNINQIKINQIKYTVEENYLNFIISPTSGWFKPEDLSLSAGEFKYDLIITMGANDLESLGKIYDNNVNFFYKTTIINIGYQSAGENFGQINLIDLNAVACAEIVFSLLKSKPDFIDENIATCLLAGIIQKTRNFKNINLTPNILLNTSELIALGAQREEIITNLYRSRNINTLKLWGKTLNNLKTENNEKFLWSALGIKDFSETNTSTEDLDNIIEELIIGLPHTEIILILCEEAVNKTKMFTYSLKNINALDFIKDYSPTGTIKCAQGDLNLDLQTAIVETTVTLKHRLDKLTS